MRSNLVSQANYAVHNRFLLCQLTAEAARTMHRTSSPVHETINSVLQLISSGKISRLAPSRVTAAAEPTIAGSQVFEPLETSPLA